MKITTRVFNDGRVELEVIGESDHENSLLTLISQKSFDGAYTSESAGEMEPTRIHMTMTYRTPTVVPESVKQQASEFRAKQ